MDYFLCLVVNTNVIIYTLVEILRNFAQDDATHYKTRGYTNTNGYYARIDSILRMHCRVYLTRVQEMNRLRDPKTTARPEKKLNK